MEKILNYLSEQNEYTLIFISVFVLLFIIAALNLIYIVIYSIIKGLVYIYKKIFKNTL